jgi:hypothetical protein
MSNGISWSTSLGRLHRTQPVGAIVSSGIARLCLVGEDWFDRRLHVFRRVVPEVEYLTETMSFFITHKATLGEVSRPHLEETKVFFFHQGMCTGCVAQVEHATRLCYSMVDGHVRRPKAHPVGGITLNM